MKREDERYSVTIHLAAPGTRLRGGGTSLTGHMYLVTHHGVDESSYGYQPAGDEARALAAAAGSKEVPGDIATSDVRDYLNPYYSRTLEITKEQYDKIREFGTDPRSHGFEMNYRFTDNSCTDFAWAALNHAGLHRQQVLGPDKDYQGEVKVLNNLPEIQMIKDPVPGSDLNRESKNPMPERDFWQHMFSKRDDHAPDQPADNPLLRQVTNGVAALDAANGRDFDATSERITASLYALARENDFSSVDHVLLSTRTATNEAAHNIFIVQGERDNPAHTRASLPTAVAAQTPVEVSFERVEQLAQVRQQSVSQSVQEQAQQQQVEEQRAGPRMA